MSPATPTMAEVTRRLDEVVTRLERLTTSLEANYLRRDVFAERMNTTEVMLQGLEDEQHALGKRVSDGLAGLLDRIEAIEEKAATNWRMALAGIVFPTMLALFGAVLYYALHGR